MAERLGMTTTTTARGDAGTGPAAPPTGRAHHPHWVRWATIALLAATGVLYLVDLSSSGTANDFYAAAVKSGTESLKAWLFGSLDSANAITVDKPPASLWLMVLSARIFGFSSFAMLLPQALMGVASVAVLHAAVKRWSGAAAGLAAGPTRAIARTKRLFDEAATSTLEEQLEREAEAQAEMAESVDFREGVSAFAEKREARFSGS